MTADRVALALDQGAFDLPPTGAIALFADEEGRLSDALPGPRLQVISPLRPVIERMERLGIAAVAELPGDAGPVASLICLPRSRAAARLAIGQAMEQTVPGGFVLVDGQKTSGIDALMREMRGRVPVLGSISKAHGKLFWVAAEAGPCADWAALGQGWPRAGGYVTAPGGFSAEGPDPASVALARALPEKLAGKIADLGAGWGYLSAQILPRPEVESLDLVEAHFGALAAARANISDPRARFHWADATSWGAQSSMDMVIMNPPFHTGRAADPGLGQAFLRSAARLLRPGGALWLVANRQLPYETLIDEIFVDMESVKAPAGFKIIHARKPAKAARARKSRR